MAEAYFVYMLASKRNGTLYVGVTNDLSRRVGEHKAGAVPGFTKQYRVDRLVYAEGYSSIARSESPRALTQALAAGLENTAHREGQSELE